MRNASNYHINIITYTNTYGYLVLAWRLSRAVARLSCACSLDLILSTRLAATTHDTSTTMISEAKPFEIKLK